MPINEYGKAIFNIEIGPIRLQKELIVADIEDDGLLGVDILQDDEQGPADILLSKAKIIFRGEEIPCIQIGMRNSIRKVTMADHVVIPPQSEALLDVYIERNESDDFDKNSDFIIEPTVHFKETYPLQMASVLVDINNCVTSKVRVLNPFPTSVTINQDAVVAQAQRISEIQTTLLEEESPCNERNNYSIRRVQFENKEIKVLREVKSAGESDKSIPAHLKDLFSRSSADRNCTEKFILASLMNDYQDIFSKSEWDLGLTHLAEHSINTGDALPIKQPPRRVPMAYASEEKKAIEDLLAKGVIRKSTSPWASPIVLVRKKNGSVRPCVDYRKVNALVKPDGFPLPRVQDCLDAVAGSTLFSTFDLTSGYFQIPLKEDDIQKSAFVCKYGHYEMLRMPFGLNNAASTFQRTMELALQGLQWETCLIYIDDIIVFSTNFEQHIHRVREVFDRLQKAGLKLRPEKCEMLQEQVTFLGQVVSSSGVKPSPVNIAKIVDWPVPANAKQVKQFVALCSYYRRFVKDFAKIVRPMVELTRKGKKFIWADDCQKSFEKLKDLLVGSDIMGYPLDNAGDFILDVDASDVGIGGVLQQIQEGRERVIAYASRALNKPERNYCITEKELLAIRYFVEYFRQYLLGRHFIVRSDHQALVWLFKLKEPRGKIARWIEILSHYDFAIEYRSGKKQGHCDALSRCNNPRDCDCSLQDMDEDLKCGPCKKCIKRANDMQHIGLMNKKFRETEEDITNDKLIRAISEPKPGPSSMPEEKGNQSVGDQTNWSWASEQNQSTIRSLQYEDPDISPILQAKIQDCKPSASTMARYSPATRHYWIIWDVLETKDGILYKRFNRKNGCGSHTQLLVPDSMKKSLLVQFHDSLLSGHMGCKKTYERLLQRYYWFGMKSDVKMYISQCDTCASIKKPNKKPKAPLGTITTGAPCDVVATDYIGPLPVTPRGNKYILVLNDHFSKYVEVIPVPDQTAETCASRVLNDFIARWGCPLSLLSDQGRNYESRVFKDLCRMLEIKKVRTSPKNPKCNGQTERFNRTLVRMIKAYLCEEQDDWDQHLGCLAGAYRSTPHESTGLTPNLLTMGREVRLPSELVYGSNTIYDKASVTSYSDYVDVLKSRMQHAHRVARDHLHAAAQRNKVIYDTKIVHNSYKAGDAVWMLSERHKVGIAHKLERTYEGPFLVKQSINDINFVVQIDKSGKEKTVHHDKLKRYEGNKIPKWINKACKVLNKQKCK